MLTEPSQETVEVSHLIHEPFCDVWLVGNKPENRNYDIQVIIKYASIVLTPENPEYKGGVWHVEGMKNESIVASAIAYLRCENITTSCLAFRTMVDEPEYEQNGAHTLSITA